MNASLRHPAPCGLLILLGLLLGACGDNTRPEAGNRSGDPLVTAAQDMRTLTGRAVKGVISNGIVQAWTLPAPNGDSKPLGKPVRTDADGAFSLQVPAAIRGWLLIRLKADDRTRMTCDVVAGCRGDGKLPVVFGERFAVGSDFALSAAVDLDRNQAAYLTPLSQLAVASAQSQSQSQGQPLTGEALARSYRNVEHWFDLAEGVLHQPAPDLTRLSNDDTDTDQIQAAVTNAAFLALANDPGWPSVGAVILAASRAVRSTGRLPQRSQERYGLSLDRIAMGTALLAAQLQQTAAAPIPHQALIICESRATHLYRSILTDAFRTSATPADTDKKSQQPVPTRTAAPSEVDHSAELSWSPPLTRQDGEGLTMAEVRGYRLLYGRDARHLDHDLVIKDAFTTRWTLADLAPGTWYFAVKAIDQYGNESHRSALVSKRIGR